MSRSERELSKGLIAGLVGGFIGTAVMTLFSKWMEQGVKDVEARK